MQVVETSVWELLCLTFLVEKRNEAGEKQPVGVGVDTQTLTHKRKMGARDKRL